MYMYVYLKLYMYCEEEKIYPWRRPCKRETNKVQVSGREKRATLTK